MEALRLRTWSSALLVLAAALMSSSELMGATWQTRNFSVTADRAEVAQRVGRQAEEYRRQLAIFWLGEPLPNWSKPCKLRVREGAVGAGGQTTFQFVRGEVLNWDMYVQGSLERILDSVLPHEINHTIFACHFRKPLPRWADEGAATLFEDRSEQLKQLALLNDVINNDRERITLQRLLSMKEYPEGMRPMLILYAQGYALADFLVQQKGRKSYLAFLADGDALGWEASIRKHFDHEGIEALERHWRGWVLAGMPKLTTPRDQMLASVPDSQTASEKKEQRTETQPVATPTQTVSRESARGPTATTAHRSTIPANTTIRSQSPAALAGNTNARPGNLSTASVRDARATSVASASRATSPSAVRGASETGRVSNAAPSDTAVLAVPQQIDLAGQTWKQPRRATIQAPSPAPFSATATAARQPGRADLSRGTELASRMEVVDRTELPGRRDVFAPTATSVRAADMKTAAANAASANSVAARSAAARQAASRSTQTGRDLMATAERFIAQPETAQPETAQAETARVAATTSGLQAAAVDQQAFDAYLDILFSETDSESQDEDAHRQARPANLEPTAAPVTSPAEASEPGGRPSASPFESVHLPAERNVNSGGTPVWAEFPGQKKLF